MLADAEAEVVELVLGREVAVDEQVRRLDERRRVALDELLDRDAAVAEDAFFAVDEGDRRLARAGVHEPVVERDEAGLVPELRDVDAELVLGAADDRELDLAAVVLEYGGGLAHASSWGCVSVTRSLSVGSDRPD